MGKTLPIEEWLEETDAKLKRWKAEESKEKGVDANILVNREDFERAIEMLSKVLRGSQSHGKVKG